MISKTMLDKIIGYLGSRPFSEVYKLLAEIQADMKKEESSDVEVVKSTNA